MNTFFNTAGPCRSDMHYMLPPERRIPEVRELIDRAQYFVVHAPRQVGKTTCLGTLAETLTAEGRYAALLASCETGQVAGSDTERGVAAVLGALEHRSDLLLGAFRPP
ncbi:MAG: ATP-binding protein, partial [Candidatus Schekmanbacteria bacterium]|nr:ATP-binding protein [Candidatus Schekmanbacteria bacterium]